MKLITLASIGLLTFLGITRAEEPSNVIGKTEFRPGDSIRITNVQRGDDFLTVTAEYELASEPEARISLHVTSSKNIGWTGSAASQSKNITKGKGSVTLHHPSVGEGMPHVSFYPAKGGSVFGGVYFGTEQEAAASRKMSASTPASPASYLEDKLQKIVFPQIQFRDATVTEAVDYFRMKSRDLDPSGPESPSKGVNIVVRGAQSSSAKITLDLKQVPLGEALKYTAELAGMEVRVESFAILLLPKGSATAGHAQTTVPQAGSSIIFPNISFTDATLDEALHYIRIKSRDIDPSKNGVNIVQKPDAATDAKITLSLRNVPVNEALRYLAELTGNKLTTEGNTFIVAPAK